MPTLIGRFNELLHHLSSSTGSSSAASPTRQPTVQSSAPVPPQPSSRTSGSHHRSGHHVHRHASLSAADRPSPVKRSHSGSRPSSKPVYPSGATSGSGSSNKSTHRDHGSTSTKSEEQHTVDGHRSRRTSHSRDRQEGSSAVAQANSQRQSNHQSSSSSSSRHREPSSTSSSSRRDSASSILHGSRRQQLASNRRRHSIASVSSANDASSTPVAKTKPAAAAVTSHTHSSTTMAPKGSHPKKVTSSSHNNNKNHNNNNHTEQSKVISVKQPKLQQQQPPQSAKTAEIASESDESLASKLARKMKIGGITRKGSSATSATAVKVATSSSSSSKQSSSDSKKQAKTGKKKSAEAETADEAKGCFIYRYLNGQLVKQHPEIISGKTCYDIPVKFEIEPLDTKVIASSTGPLGGLCNGVKFSQPKPLYLDLAEQVDFIDEDYPDSSLSSSGGDLLSHTPKSSLSTVSSDTLATSSANASPVNALYESKIPSCNLDSECTPIAGINDWNAEKDFAYGVSTSLYESHPSTRRHAGDPVADSFAVVLRENSSILALADGVNWGEKACLASRCAVYGAMDYLNKALYSPAESTRIRNTLDIFVALLRAFQEAHTLILENGGHLTTLCAAVICQLKNSDRFIVCTCNVGDSLAYVYSPLYGVREITQESHDIFSMRDMRDALGALGPVSGREPELNNLTVAMTIVDPGDIVFLTSDGISDNFDPVVGKFAMPKKEATEVKPGGVSPVEAVPAPVGKAGKASKVSSKPRKSVQRSNSNPERSTSRRLPPVPLNPDNYTSKGLPLVSAKQRHELTLLRMEDLIMNGVNSVSLYSSALKKTARELCSLMVDFATKLTMAKRRILEDPELYSDSEEDLVGGEAFTRQRQRRRQVGHKLVQMPGKLDHASIVAVEIGFYGALAAKRASLVPLPVTQRRSTSTRNGSASRQPQHWLLHSQPEDDLPANKMKIKATLARFESQDFLECCCESGPI